MSAVVRKFTGGYWIVGFSSCRWGGCSEGFRKSNYRICISIQISLSGFGRKTDKEKLSGITAGSPVTKIIWVAVQCNVFCKLLCLLEGKSMGKFGLVGFVLVFWLLFCLLVCWFLGFFVPDTFPKEYFKMSPFWFSCLGQTLNLLMTCCWGNYTVLAYLALLKK